MAAPTYKQATDAIIRRLKIISGINDVIRWSDPLDVFEDSICNAPFIGVVLRNQDRSDQFSVVTESVYLEVLNYELFFVVKDFSGAGAKIEAAEELLDDIRDKLLGYTLNNGATPAVNYDVDPIRWGGFTKDENFEAGGACAYLITFSTQCERQSA